MDSVSIQGLSVMTLIGVYDWERVDKREVIVDLVLYHELSVAALSDDVKDTLDYAAIADCIEQVALVSEFKLLEALAGAFFNALFDAFPVNKVGLTIHKPDILPNAKDVSISMTRQRS